MIYILCSKRYSKIKIGFFFQVMLNLTVLIILVQILIGFMLIFFHLYKNKIGIFEIFKQKKIRFKLIEHPITMIVGFLIFILFYQKLYQNHQITHTVLFLFFLSVLFFLIRFPFNLI
ncbi:hypothetical protein [Blattabacterium cuenoti]|uniref:hypothetical protein n=1 Tax=Blattabacterium cuenoti TaxID=1653831 RepID=UPI00163CC540|nr:hypothetical protein [Blattabacterium cuenoti]